MWVCVQVCTYTHIHIFTNIYTHVQYTYLCIFTMHIYTYKHISIHITFSVSVYGTNFDSMITTVNDVMNHKKRVFRS